MDTTAVGGEMVEYSKEQLFWAFQFLSTVLWARLKLRRLCFVRLHSKHFNREVGLSLYERHFTVYFR